MPKRKSTDVSDELEQYNKQRRLDDLSVSGTGSQHDTNEVIELANSLTDERFERRYMLSPGVYELIYQPSDNARRLDVYVKSGPTLTPVELEACISLRKQYLDTSSVDYDPKKVKKDMRAKGTRYLLIRPYTPMGTKRPEAYIRLELGFADRKPVLFIHDLHLATSVREIGLAAFLLRIVDEIATRVPVRMIFSSYPASSRSAAPFFDKAGFHRVSKTSNAATVAVVKHVSSAESNTAVLQETNHNVRKSAVTTASTKEKQDVPTSDLNRQDETTVVNLEVKMGFCGDGRTRTLEKGDAASDRRSQVDECLKRVRKMLMQETDALVKQGRSVDWSEITMQALE